MRNTAGRLGWKIDTRGYDGFVVGAGSVCAAARYRVTNEAPIQPLPMWLATLLTAPPSRPAAAATAERCLPRHAGAYLRAIITAESAMVAAAQPGSRHTTLLAAAVTLGRLVA